MVTKEFLVKGAVYALEQCGLLLLDAVALVDQKSYSSAIVLAAFAREELGRSRILINFFDEIVKNGKTVTLEDINKVCKEHVDKQKWGQVSIVFKFQYSSQAGKLMLRRMELAQQGKYQSEEYKEIDIKISEIMEKITKRTPGDRHKARAMALYVEPNSVGSDWNIPRKVDPDFARDFIMDASNDYSAQREILNSSFRLNPELSEELSKWSDKPEVPLPKWPKFE
jgi:AbiV family abortive infection protein